MDELTQDASNGAIMLAEVPVKPVCPPLTTLAVADPRDDCFHDYFAARLKAAVPRVIGRLAPLLDEQTRRGLLHNGELFAALSEPARRAIVTHPLFHFYWLKIMEACRDGADDYVRSELPDLARFMVISLLAEGRWDGEPLPVRIRAGELRFPGHRRHVRHVPAAGAVAGTVSRRGDDLIIGTADGRTVIGVPELLGRAEPAPGSPVVTRAVMPGSEIELDGGDPYVARLFASMRDKPAVTGEPQRDLSIMDEIAPGIIDAFGAAHDLIASAWPEILPELHAYTRLVIPFRSRTYSTFTENALMGAVFMAESRQPFSSVLYTAEHLLHEHSHLRLALIMEVDPLYETSRDTRFHSPWRGTDRPVLGIVQGAFVFARISYFLDRAYRATGERVFLRRRAEIVADLRAALTILTTTSDVEYTDLGAALLADLAAEADRPNSAIKDGS